jgi:hypothetical protein
MTGSRRLVTVVVGTAFAVGVGVATAGGASAAIHPIMNGWVCGSASGDPPGQEPGGNHSDTSTFRALQATGVLTVTESGPVLDLTDPAAKFSTFDPATETGTPSNPGGINCTESAP